MIIESIINLIFLIIGYFIGKEQKIKFPKVPEKQAKATIVKYISPRKREQKKNEKLLLKILNNAKDFITKRKS